jgi:hypothetical protein
VAGDLSRAVSDDGSKFMTGNIKDWVGIIADIATASAFVVAAIQLILIRRQNKIDSHLNFVHSEREIWLAALSHKDMAPKILSATWNNTPDTEPSEELFLAILLDHYEHQFIRHERGMDSGKQWPRIEGYIVHQLSSEPAHAIWNAIKKYYSRDFVDYFDKKISGNAKASL